MAEISTATGFDDDSLEQKVFNFLIEQLGADPEELMLKTNLQEDLKMDSLDGVELVMWIEGEFEIGVPDEDVAKMRTVGDVVDYIRTHLPPAS